MCLSTDTKFLASYLLGQTLKSPFTGEVVLYHQSTKNLLTRKQKAACDNPQQCVRYFSNYYHEKIVTNKNIAHARPAASDTEQATISELDQFTPVTEKISRESS